MRTFVDIGSHRGQTLEEVVKPRWGFDRIHAIEPMPREFAVIEERFGDQPAVRFHAIALGYMTGDAFMYGTNEQLEASFYSHKTDVDASVRTTVHCVDASEWFGEHAEGDLYVNLNAEGAEFPILESLLWTGEIKRITAMQLSWDMKKVPGLAGHIPMLAARLNHAGVTWTADYADLPTHQEQIAAWLGRFL
jgi:FkbM family methyltransferase